MIALDYHYGSAYIIARDPHGNAGGLSDFGGWYYRRELGTWRVSVSIPNITNDGEPYDGAMVGTAVCDDFGVLRVIGRLS